MPCNDCPLEQALAKTKSSKSSKKEKKCCATPCNVECCLPDCQLDCCTLPYQRLNKLSTAWSINSATGDAILPTAATASGSVYTVNGVTDRSGNGVVTPVATTFGASNGIALVTGTTSLTIALDNAYYAYLFVNTSRYVSFESCGKVDQVIGWLVDFGTGNLEIFQNLPEYNLLITDNRATLDVIAPTSLTSVQKQKLYNLNVLYKLSQQAAARVGQDPKEEGNICQFTDKCGQNWLLAINRASAGTSVANPVSQYVIVGVRLC